VADSPARLSHVKAVATLLTGTRATTRGGLVGLVAIAVLARLSVLGGAFAVGASEPTRAAVFGALAMALFAGQRVLQTTAKVLFECDLLRDTARTLLETDVLEGAEVDPQRLVFQGSHDGVQLLAVTLPALAADVVVSFVAAPLLLSAFPPRVLVVATIGLGAVIIGVALVSRTTRGLQERVNEAYAQLADALVFAIDGRLELVAAGGEAAMTRRLEEALARYLRLTRRSSAGSALLGRAPLAAAVLAVSVGVALDASTRTEITAAVLSQAVVFAACLPPVIGAALGAHTVVRGIADIAPYARLLARPRRPDVLRRGAPAPALPSAFAFEDVAFAYADGGPFALRGLTFSWSGAEPLVVTGPNGSGKSTVLRLLLALRPASSGAITLGGEPLGTVDVGALRADAAYLPQRPYLGEAWMPVRAAMGALRADVGDDAMRRALARTGVLDVLSSKKPDPLAVPVGELSSGQRQRVALARVLACEAKLVLLDEPEANLDAAGVEMVGRLVRELAAEGRMVAVAVHAASLAGVSAARLDLAPEITRRTA
jgi:ABC-type multidrug transport system fused ATPase/permease subunit